MAHFCAYLDDVEYKTTPAKEFGKLSHLYVFQPRKAKDLIVNSGCPDKRLKGFKDVVKSNPEKIVVSSKEYKRLQNIRTAINRNPKIIASISGGFTEVTVFAVCPVTGLPIKARFDFVDGAWSFILDMKTTEDAAPSKLPSDPQLRPIYSKFEKNSAALHTHVQAAFYRWAAKLVGHNIQEYFILAQESEGSCVSQLYFYPQEVLDKGEELFQGQLPKIKEAIASGVFPGYSDKALPLLIPDYCFEEQW